MRIKILAVICFLIGLQARATDTLVIVKDSLIKGNGTYPLRQSVKWKFNEGKDGKWVSNDFDDSAWPETTFESFRNMQSSGKAYCFRIHIRSDSSIKEPLYIRSWQALPSIVFINGKQLNRYGEDAGFGESRMGVSYNQPVLIRPGENVIVVFLDFRTRNFLKQYTFIDLPPPVNASILTEQQVYFWRTRTQTYGIIQGAMLAGLGMLVFFSWFLIFQNRPDKGTRWVAIIISLILVDRIIDFLLLELGFIFKDIAISIALWNIVNPLWVFLIAPVISNIVKNTTDRPAKTIFIVSTVVNLLINSFSSVPVVKQYGTPFGLLLGGVVVVYIILLLKNNLLRLSKPQWTVVAGLFITLVAGIVTILMEFYLSNDYRWTFLSAFITYISFPVSLLIYASLTLRQNIITIQHKASEIAELSAEKEKILKEQNEELERQVEVRTAELRASQNQLIQKEKLASLGELTAGIAHEIQNPLNFVNNFSELSGELIDEMNEEMESGDLEEAKAIAGDLKQNIEKINHHGKRASSIVKGMLEHSRASTGVKQLTDINALCDECLRLSYHGMRAKNNNSLAMPFNADFKTDFDTTLPEINVIPQDLGRVLLNLLNNAFYAVYQQSKTGVADYKPMVTIATRNLGNTIEIKVQDNGGGIPESIKSKIFQPFFTTKPTGEGTGLGLSLSYDIITKGHNGTIEAETPEGEGTTIVVRLPVS